MSNQERAKEIMTLALGVGISTIQSEALVLTKLEEYQQQDYDVGYAEGLKAEPYDDGPEYENR